MLNSRKTLINTIIFLVWIIVAVTGVIQHEFWRDEMRALSIAISAPGFSDLPAFLKNEGHPILWYFILKFAYTIFHSTSVLPVVSILFSAGISWLIVFRSPFHPVIKVLLIFGYYCLYEYGINCRNYGIAAFFFLLFAELYSRRPDRIILGGLYLALAAQANVYASMVAALIGLWLVVERLINKKADRKVIIAILLLTVSLIVSFIVIYPDQNTLVVNKKIIDLNLFRDVWLVGYGFQDYMDHGVKFSIYILSSLLFVGILMFLNRPAIFIVLLLGLLGMSFFSLCIKGNLSHHMGMYFYMLLVFYWINSEGIKSMIKKEILTGILFRISVSVNIFIFSILFVKGLDRYHMDLKVVKSESKSFGNWCNLNLSNRDILIAEPDFTMEGVMFYHYQPFYIPRENRRGTYVNFTTRNKSYQGLHDFIRTADSLSNGYVNTYLVFSKRVANSDSIYSYSYAKKFKVTTEDFKDLSIKYNLEDSFNHNFQNEENYYIYKRRNGRF